MRLLGAIGFGVGFGSLLMWFGFKMLKRKNQKQKDEIQRQTIELKEIENLVSELEMQRQEILDQLSEIISRHPGLDAQFSLQR